MATSSKLPEGLYIFEQPFLRAPNETLRRHFRAIQKLVEKDMVALKTLARDVSTAKKGSSGQTSADAIAVLDGMIAKAEGLQKKALDVHEKGTAPTITTLRARLQHLEELDKMEVDDGPADAEMKDEEKDVSLEKPTLKKGVSIKPESKEPQMDLENWTDIRLDRWIIDWSLRNGLHDTAALIAKERNLEDLVDLSIFAEVRRIEDALSRKSCTEALAWCSDNKNALRKNKSTLEFELRLQEYIELARAEKTPEAVVYWKKYLQSWQDTHLLRMQQAASLLTFPANTKIKTYQRLYSDQRWALLTQAFRRAIYNLHSLPNQPLLHYAISAGLTALKLPACIADESNSAPAQSSHLSELPFSSYNAMLSSSDIRSISPSKMPPRSNPDCPVCDATCLGALAHEVPFSHHANSTIVCRMSGKIMNADNPPMAFENGMVYSEQALNEMASKNKGLVKCPRTGIEQPFTTLRKVFIT